MRAALILALLLLNGCDQNMVQQPRYDDFERSPLSANGSAMGAPPEGAVAQDAVARAAQELIGTKALPCPGEIEPGPGHPHAGPGPCQRLQKWC